MSGELQLLYVTCPDREVATTISHVLIAEKLAACVNIFPAGLSVYEWEGEVQQAKEVVMIVKTTATNSEQAMSAIVQAHPYDCPCVITLPVGLVHAPFGQWVVDSVR